MTLREFFEHNKNVAVAFSGGVDSAYLLYAAVKYAENVRAYYVKTAFQPQFELDDALRMAEGLGADMKIIEADILTHKEITENPAGRCYHCKKFILGEIIKAAKADGFGILLDGTNASDSSSDRPGMRALTELNIKSPLRECGLSKAEIRALSREAGLFTWCKPAYACLATRIGQGEKITAQKLESTEKAENFLSSLEFEDFRVRMRNGGALVQVKSEQYAKAEKDFEIITKELLKYYNGVSLDTEVRR